MGVNIIKGLIWPYKLDEAIFQNGMVVRDLKKIHQNLWNLEKLIFEETPKSVLGLRVGGTKMVLCLNRNLFGYLNSSTFPMETHVNG